MRGSYPKGTRPKGAKSELLDRMVREIGADADFSTILLWLDIREARDRNTEAELKAITELRASFRAASGQQAI